jgi:uncharacterized damage-inducible protein DinB
MEAIEYVRRQIEAMHRMSDSAIKDMTEEQLNWVPSGEVNPIRAALLHLLGSQDFFLQTVIQGRPTVWEAGAWADKIGVASLPGRGRGWEEAKTTHMALKPLLAYRQAVAAAMDDYLAALTPEELDRQVNLFGGPRSVADALILVVAHTMTHVGEIAAVKGMQGVKGLPF